MKPRKILDKIFDVFFDNVHFKSIMGADDHALLAAILPTFLHEC